MKRFSFRLNSILNYRGYLERRAQRDLFNVRNEYMEREKTVKRLAEKRREIARKRSDEGFRGIDVSLYQIYRSFLQKLDQDLENAHMSVKEGKEKVEAQQAVLKKESIKKRTLEILRDLQLRKHLEGLEREEQKVLDELVIIRKGSRG